MAEPEDLERLKGLLEQRLADAREIRDFFEQDEYKNIEGKSAFLCKVAAEEKFLEKFTVRHEPPEKKFLETSNLISLSNLVKEIPKHRDVKAVLKTFTLNCEEAPIQKLKVDLVAEKGRTWIKVVSRSPKGICSDWVTGNGRNIFEQADDYLMMASALKQVDLLQVIFVFCSGITDRMAGKLEKKGVEVRGELLPQNSIMRLSEDFDAELDEEEEQIYQNGVSSDRAVVNLDVSAVFVLISNLTHPGGCDKQLTSSLLMMQAADERQIKAREQLLADIGEREMIICQTAYDSVQSILSTVAGAQEKRRAEELFQKVRIVPDDISVRAERLESTERISDRCKTIFGTGDTHKAITASANKHCVSSAVSQGVHFDVILHPSRALSEKKEVDYVGPR